MFPGPGDLRRGAGRLVRGRALGLRPPRLGLDADGAGPPVPGHGAHRLPAHWTANGSGGCLGNVPPRFFWGVLLLFVLSFCLLVFYYFILFSGGVPFRLHNPKFCPSSRGLGENRRRALRRASRWQCALALTGGRELSSDCVALAQAAESCVPGTAGSDLLGN